MTARVVSLECPGCGASASRGQDVCGFCNGPIIIFECRSIISIELSKISQYAQSYREAQQADASDSEIAASLGICYLRLGLYEEAERALNRAVGLDTGNSEVFFCIAACALRGRRPFDVSL